MLPNLAKLSADAGPNNYQHRSNQEYVVYQRQQLKTTRDQYFRVVEKCEKLERQREMEMDNAMLAGEDYENDQLERDIEDCRAEEDRLMNQVFHYEKRLRSLKRRPGAPRLTLKQSIDADAGPSNYALPEDDEITAYNEQKELRREFKKIGDQLEAFLTQRGREMAQAAANGIQYANEQLDKTIEALMDRQFAITDEYEKIQDEINDIKYVQTYEKANGWDSIENMPFKTQETEYASRIRQIRADYDKLHKQDPKSKNPAINQQKTALRTLLAKYQDQQRRFNMRNMP